ncbi:MAG: hypothetical protein ACI9Y1_001609 [Lentisphaeria bacterium]|jgi:hypothetical protein
MPFEKVNYVGGIVTGYAIKTLAFKHGRERLGNICIVVDHEYFCVKKSMVGEALKLNLQGFPGNVFTTIAQSPGAKSLNLPR